MTKAAAEPVLRAFLNLVVTSTINMKVPQEPAAPWDDEAAEVYRARMHRNAAALAWLALA